MMQNIRTGVWLVLCLSVAPAWTDVDVPDQVTVPQSLLTLLQLGEQQRQQGHLRQAVKTLTQARTLTGQSSNLKAQTLLTGLLGYTYSQQQRTEEAEPLLKQAWQASVQNGWPELAAIHANYLGNHALQHHKLATAQHYYRNSLNWALNTPDQALSLQARLNLARLAQRQANPAAAWQLLQSVSQTLSAIASPDDRLHLGLQTGYQILTFKTIDTKQISERIQLGYQTLQQALTLAQQTGDTRAQSLALGYLGQLYESQKRYQDALIYADQALTLAQSFNGQDLLLQWEWLRGRLLKAQDRTQPALAAYRRAVHYIQIIRQDIPVNYYQGRSSFRETLEPVYLGLADLLLRQAEKTQTQAMQILLKEARQTVELIKKTELEDYFNNRCDIQTLPNVSLERIAPKTATLYPVMLPERLGLLLSINDTLYYRSVPVGAPQVRQTARKLARNLRSRRHYMYRKQAQQLHRWLIAPIKHLLQQQAINTLVIIPDGALRLIPFAALWDGTHHLIERYALVTSPGLSLFDPRPLPHQRMTALLAGLSEPGPVIKTLPKSHLYNLLAVSARQTGYQRPTEARSRDISRLLLTERGAVSPVDTEVRESQIQAWLNDPVILKKAQQKLALPGVEQEIKQLASLLPSTILFNETFVHDKFDQEIQATTPYPVVHLASHGVFGHSSNHSFIMAYDRVLTLDDLQQLLSAEKLAQTPIELLTLSACQTAEGDDRSPLGISGMALKAKVRSVLGSLWPVSDRATMQLMQGFYRQLNTPRRSKAQALQHAQTELLRTRKYRHPYYWSAFILVGNWL